MENQHKKLREQNPANPSVSVEAADLQKRLTDSGLAPVWRAAAPTPAELEAKRKFIKPAVVIMAVLMAVELILFLVINGSVTPAPWSIPFVIACLLLDLKLLIYWSGAISDPKRDLTQDSRNKDEHLVRMWVEVDGEVTGSDKGVLWFDNNAVWFNGDRSWFRIPRQDIAEPTASREPSGANSLRNMAASMILAVRHDGAAVRIGIQTPLRIRGLPSPIFEVLDLPAALRAFLASSSASDTAIQFPPLGADPAYDQSWSKRPQSKLFRTLMTSPLFSARLYMAASAILAIVMGALVAGQIQGASLELLLLPVLLVSSRLLGGLRTGGQQLTQGRPALADLPGAREANVGERLQSATAEVLPLAPAGKWLPSSEAMLSRIQRTEALVSWVTVGLAGIEIGVIGAGIIAGGPVRDHLFAALGVCLILNTLVFGFLRRPPKEENDPRLYADADDHRYLVKVWVEIDGVIRGGDVGRLSFNEDAITFDGLRSRFVIGRQDELLKKRVMSHFGHEVTHIQPDFTIWVNREQGSLGIGVRVLKDSLNPSQTSMSLAKEYVSRMISGGRGSQESILPPLSFDDQCTISPWLPTVGRLRDRFGPILFILGMFAMSQRSLPSFVGAVMIGLGASSLGTSILPVRLRALWARTRAKKSRTD
jgi:hypothetical protein